MQQKPASLWKLFSVFFRIGAFTFGGGLAMLPLIEREVVEVQGWVHRDEILDIVALSQSVPGAIAVNSAIFIGLRLRGLIGAIAALLGTITPSIGIILIIAHFFTQFQSSPILLRAFSGVKAAVIGLLAAAAYRSARNAVVNRYGVVVAICAFVLSVSGLLPIVWIIILGGLSGILYFSGQKGGEAQ
ncbi:MAG: chromate transporter [Limnochordia bacterium]|nr:chromate transporter [Bacillota bacterium]NLL07664.1 chromate transporter [Bacillota bacterium]